MLRGKLIVIEGTDCSGKQTQSELLVKKLKEEGVKIERFSFPCYESAPGKIVGGPILGKSHIGECIFEEGASNIDPRIFSLYLAADRKYNISKINELLEQGVNVILDRYVYSNMAFQGSKLKNELEILEFFSWVEKLEFEMLELPKSDINIFLHMPVDNTIELLKKRKEKMDEHEKDFDYLRKVEQTYFLLANKYNFKKIECVDDNNIKTINDINEELIKYVEKQLKI